MFGVAAVVAFAIALILQLANIHKGHLLVAATFVIIGLLCLALDRGYGWYATRRGT